MPKLPDFSRCGLLEPPMLPSSLRFGMNMPPVSGIPSSPGQDMLLDRSPPILDPLAIHRKLLSQQKAIGGTNGGGLTPTGNNLSSSGLANMMGGNIPPSPSLYEMAALTNELDTQTVTTKVKEILLSNNVGQKVSRISFLPRFGRLNIKQSFLETNLSLSHFIYSCLEKLFLACLKAL